MKAEPLDVHDEVPVSELPRIPEKATRKLESVSLEDGDGQGKRKILKRETFCSNSETGNNKEFNRIPLNPICEICTTAKPRYDFFRISGCAHYYCCSCIDKYIASKLQENVTMVNCPSSGCKGKLEPHYCSEILSKEVFNRWGDALCEAVILASEKCYCPFNDCSAMLINDKLNGVIVESECPHCYRLFCARCMVPWHVGINCEDFQKMKVDERSNDDIMLMELAKSKKWQRCPDCGFYVEKIDHGCLTIDCRCKRSFCYKCAATLKGGRKCEACVEDGVEQPIQQ